MLEVSDISFAYLKRNILCGVTFSAAPSEPIAVLGANGAGKTTLLKVLSGLALPTKGKVCLDGRDIIDNGLRYRKQLGYMPEKIMLADDMKVREYLVYRAVLKGESTRRASRRVEDVLKLCSLGDYSRTYISELSLGQKKMVAIADAILLKPRVLVLDDVYSGLDMASRKLVTGILSACAKNSMIVVSGHEVEDLARWVKRFLVLENGVVAKEVAASGESGVSALEVRKILQG